MALRSILCYILIALIMLVGFPQACEAREIVLRFFAAGYTPGIMTGDVQKPLYEMERIVKEWEALHPGVKVRFVNQPAGDIRTWMLTQLKGGMAPDIMWAHSEWCNEDARYGWFVPLDPFLNEPNKYIPGNERWLDVFYQDATNAKRAPDGTLYSLPIDQVETGIFYNKDIFREVGVEPPDTWAEFMEVSRKIQEAGYIAFLAMAQNEMQLSWAKVILHDQLWNDKVHLIDIREQEAGGFEGVDAQEFVRAYKKGIWSLRDPRYLEMFRILKDWSQYWNEDALSNSGDRLFRTGNAAMFWDGSWYTSRIGNDPLRKWEFGVFPIPRLTEETTPYAPDIQPRGVGGATSIQYAITAKYDRDNEAEKRRVELAVDLLRYITAPQNLGPLVAEAELFLPNSPGVEGSPILEPFKQTLEAGHVLFRGEEATSMYGAQAFRILQGYLGGSYTLEQAIERLERFLEPAVDRLIRDNPQWNFDENWEILPDTPRDQLAIFEEQSPPFVKYIPWTLLGMILMGSAVGVTVTLSRNWREFWKKKGIYLFIAPTMLLLLVFNYYPIFSAFYHSFFDWKGGGQAIWLGLGNYIELFSDIILAESSLNAIKLLLFGIFVTLTFPLAAAELIFHLKSPRAQYIYRVLFIIPMVVPGVVMLLIWGFIYGYDVGVLNQLFRSVGLENHVQVWLGDPQIALYALMFMGFPWIGGFSLLIYFAGLQNISQDVIDSSKIDGASALSRIWNIDIPLIMGQIKLLVILGFIGGVQGFQTQLLLTQGGPGYSTIVPGLHLYESAISYDRMGYACAIGVILFIIILGLTYVNMKYLKSSTEYEAK